MILHSVILNREIIVSALNTLEENARGRLGQRLADQHLMMSLCTQLAVNDIFISEMELIDDHELLQWMRGHRLYLYKHCDPEDDKYSLTKTTYRNLLHHLEKLLSINTILGSVPYEEFKDEIFPVIRKYSDALREYKQIREDLRSTHSIDVG